jgi:hypothetical protein
MRLGIVFAGKVCLLVLLAMVAVLSLRFADNGVARAQDPVSTYYFSATSGTTTPLATCWAVDTKQTQGSYRIFKVIAAPSTTPTHSEQRVTGSGPNGSGDYIMFICPIQPGGEDDLPLAYFYVSGL